MYRSNKAALACLAAASLLLVGCGTTKVAGEPPPPLADPCPVEATADLQAAPAHPIPLNERGPIYAAIAQTLGLEKGQALVRYWEAEMPSWGRLGWERAKRTKDWCQSRPKP